MADKELILYSRTIPCPDCDRAKRLLDEHGLPYKEIMIDLDPEAQARVKQWTGFHSVPTLVIARAGDVGPVTEPRPLEPGRSPRGVDRGPLITEPDAIGLRHWLAAHGFIVEG